MHPYRSQISRRTMLRQWASGLLVLAIPATVLAVVVATRPRHQLATTVVLPVALASAAVRPPGAAARPSKAVMFADGCRTTECHSSMLPPATLHAPVAKDACASCHGPDAGGHTYPLLQTGDALCEQCHTSIRGPSADHIGTSLVGCAACHDPHASTGPKLLRAASVAESCTRCHVMSDGPIHHAPHEAGACTVCHAPHGDGLPAGKKNTARATESGCRTCHPGQADAVARSPHTGEKVPRSCLACHRPHTAELKALLPREPREMCVECHKSIGVAAAGRVTHDALIKDRQCVSCHAAHASERPAMLRDTQAAVCESCHGKPLKATDGREIPAMPAGRATDAFVHGPVAAGDCAACHTVHGSDQARLLKRVNPAVLAGESDTRNYAMCFLCHESQLLLSESASDTWFRNGATNLHRTHLLSGDKSRTCSACHVAHASNRPKLMADSVSFQGSAWKMPLKFTQTAGGGSCSPGCHEPMEYRRDPSSDRHALPRGAP